jgi:ribosomal protein S18 acetylase RimI-like enzyme
MTRQPFNFRTWSNEHGRFVNATISDTPTVLALYEKGSEFQKTAFGKGWQFIDTVRLQTEIKERRLWKIVESGAIACIFSVVYSDPILWRDLNADPAMYLHRIVTNPDFRGRGYVTKITDWSRAHAAANGLRYVRLDTWEDNGKLVDLYLSNGFRYVSTVELSESDATPKHYVGNRISLFEIDLNGDTPASEIA